MSDQDTYAMMDELHAAVARLEQRRWNDFLGQPHIREFAEALAAIGRAGFSMDDLILDLYETQEE